MAMFGANIASYMSVADGNLSSGSTWALIDSASANDADGSNHTGTYNDALLPHVSTTAYRISTGTFSYVSSPPTIDGIAIRIISRLTAGTITVALNASPTTDVSGTVCTCNVTDLPQNGWAFFKFASPVTLATGTTYAIKYKTSTAGTVTAKYATSTQLCCLLRTTTTGTVPSNATTLRDNMFMLGEISGAGSVTGRTVTWDCTDDSFPFNSISVGGFCTLTLENTAATAYYMHIQNDMRVYDTGIVNIGTVGTPVRSNSSFKCTMHYTAANVTSIIINSGGTFKAFGTPRTVTRTTVAASFANGATSFTVADATGWAVGDQLAITASNLQNQKVTITSISGTTIGCAAITWARTYSATYPLYVLNLTRNVLFTGFNTTTCGNFVNQNGGQTILNYVEFNAFNSGYAGMSGLMLRAIDSLIDVQYCSFHDAPAQWYSIYIGYPGGAGSLLFAHNDCYSGGTGWLGTDLIGGFTGTAVIDDNVFLAQNSSGLDTINWGLGIGASFTNNTITNCSNSGAFAGIKIVATGTCANMTGNNFLYGSGIAFSISSVMTSTDSLKIYIGQTKILKASYGFVFVNLLTNVEIVIDELTSQFVQFDTIGFSSTMIGTIVLSKMNIDGGDATARGIRFPNTDNSAIFQLTISDSVFGAIAGFDVGDFYITKTLYTQVYCQNCKFLSTKTFSTSPDGQGLLTDGSFIGSDRHQQQNNNYASYQKYATTTRDDSIFATTAPSLRVRPRDAVFYQVSGVFIICVPDGATPTFSIRVRKSNTAAGDAATYNGSQPTLWIAQNSQAGITTGLLQDTATSASDGAWETLNGIMPAVTGDSFVGIFVQSNGTTGWINLDDFSTSQTTSDAGGMSYSRGGSPQAILGNGSNIKVPIPITRKKVY